MKKVAQAGVETANVLVGGIAAFVVRWTGRKTYQAEPTSATDNWVPRPRPPADEVQD